MSVYTVHVHVHVCVTVHVFVAPHLGGCPMHVEEGAAQGLPWSGGSEGRICEGGDTVQEPGFCGAKGTCSG